MEWIDLGTFKAGDILDVDLSTTVSVDKKKYIMKRLLRLEKKSGDEFSYKISEVEVEEPSKRTIQGRS